MQIVYFVEETRTPFVLNDIKRIAKQAKSVYLFSTEKLANKENLPSNVLVLEEYIDWQKFKPLEISTINFFSILGIYFNECIKLKRVLPFMQSVKLLVSNIHKANSILQTLNKIHVNPSQVIFYSFWFYDCIYLAWMKKKRRINKAITRAHGGDLFEERGSLRNKILFRHFQFKYLDCVLSVSKAGENYFNSKYPAYKKKVRTVYLGSFNHSYSNPFDSQNSFVLVSCAGVRNIKRIHVVAEMLMHVNFPLTWFHIGEENLDSERDSTIILYKENIKKLQDKTNIQINRLGSLSNREVFDFYEKQQVNLFISLSEAEGVPVSMMEAISFGIPVLSTDVGGCKEIVTENTGILISLETSTEKVASKITEFRDSSLNSQKFRIGVRHFWEKNFDANKNYDTFLNILRSDCED